MWITGRTLARALFDGFDGKQRAAAVRGRHSAPAPHALPRVSIDVASVETPDETFKLGP